MADTRLVVGCMTGTSLDGIDAALVEIRGRGLGMSARVVRATAGPLGEIGVRLRALAEQVPMTAGEIAGLSRELALVHARAVAEVCGAAKPDLVCAHGQTVFHKPPLSWQLLNGAVLAAEVGCKVVFDLRAADLAAGGQGAPITPMADWVLFRAVAERTVVVNLGGFVNFTRLRRDAGPEEVEGGDVCACNHVLDAVARRTLGTPFDESGAAASAGSVDDVAMDDLLGVMRAQRAARRSLGTGDEVVSWIGRQWRGGVGVAGSDLAATACAAIGQMIAEVTAGADVILLAGGGTKNKTLAVAVASRATARVETTAAHGVGVDVREAASFAVLGALSEDRVPITLRKVTGGNAGVVSGVWCGDGGVR